jgi:hypothetical protein
VLRCEAFRALRRQAQQNAAKTLTFQDKKIFDSAGNEAQIVFSSAAPAPVR